MDRHRWAHVHSNHERAVAERCDPVSPPTPPYRHSRQQRSAHHDLQTTNTVGMNCIDLLIGLYTFHNHRRKSFGLLIGPQTFTTVGSNSRFINRPPDLACLTAVEVWGPINRSMQLLPTVVEVWGPMNYRKFYADGLL